MKTSSAAGFAFAALLAVAAVTPAAATLGLDVSSATMPTAFKCLKSAGYEFAIIRAYQSNGVPDPVGPHTVYNAWTGGMGHVDVYMFPCHGCGNPAGQMQSMIGYLKRYNVTQSTNPRPHSFGMVWLDIEGPQYWGSQSSNRDFIQGLINEANAMGLGSHLGVYTSESQWSPITGNWAGASHLPLWYPHYDGSASFSDFRAFGGWSRPAIKQFAGTTSACGASIDRNFY